MIKSELVARLTARYPHLYHRDVERIVTTVLDSITKALAEGHRVELRGFGAFSVKLRQSRMGGNPRTGEPGAGARVFLAPWSRWRPGFPGFGTAVFPGSQIPRHSQHGGGRGPCRGFPGCGHY